MVQNKKTPPLNYDLNKIKFSTDEATFERAVGLYESGKVAEVKEFGGGYDAVVLGTKPYHVSISSRRYKDSDCTCYLGQKGTLCKHIAALALHAVSDGKPLSAEDKQQHHQVKFSGLHGALSKDELTALKKSITASMRYIKPYTGPSRTWFANQDSLGEGCNMLSAMVSNLPANKQTAEILVRLLLRLDKKLCTGGVDDSNGIVGGFISEVVQVLEKFSQMNPECVKAFELLVGRKTCFQWEESLIRILDERDCA